MVSHKPGGRVDKQQQLLEGMCGIRSSELKRKFQGKLAYHAYLTSPTFFKEIQKLSKHKGSLFPSGTIAPKSGLRKFRHGTSFLERAVNLAGERWTLRA